MDDTEPSWNGVGGSECAESWDVAESLSSNNPSGYTDDSELSDAGDGRGGEPNGHQGGYVDTGLSRNEPGGESWYNDPDGGFRAPKLRPDPESVERRDLSESGTGSGIGLAPRPVRCLVV
jgi:hypothetical protein